MFEIDKRKFGSYITELRKSKGYTQSELADKLYISNKAISKWETGVSIPDVSLLIPLADILGVSVTELLMNDRVDEKVQMDSDEVETLIKSAIYFRDESMERMRRLKHLRIIVYLLCVLLSCIENLIIYKEGLMTEFNMLFVSMGIIFGAYCAFSKALLPAYYDNRKLRLNSNETYRKDDSGIFEKKDIYSILNTGYLWSLVAMTVFPVIYGLVNCLVPFDGIYIAIVLVFGVMYFPIKRISRKCI